MITCPHCGKLINRDHSQSVAEFTQDDLKRFWKSVVKSENGCWICTKQPSATYARLTMGGQHLLAHVASYILHFGKIPEGYKVCHSCDTPRCVKPEHLSVKPQSENMQEMVSRNRHKPLRGSDNPLSKFTEQQVLDIRHSLTNGFSIGDLAATYGVSFQSIYQIARGNVWKHIGGPLIVKRTVRSLSRDEVRQIRLDAQLGHTQTDIGVRFGIHQAVVSNIVRGIRRKDVPMP